MLTTELLFQPGVTLGGFALAALRAGTLLLVGLALWWGLRSTPRSAVRVGALALILATVAAITPFIPVTAPEWLPVLPRLSLPLPLPVVPAAWIGWGLLAGWGVGALAMGCRLLVGLRARRRLWKAAVSPSPELEHVVASMWPGMGGIPEVRVAPVSGALVLRDGPKPRLLLSTGAEEWNEQQMASVLRHEHTHVENRDLRRRVLVGTIHALIWPAPFLRALVRRTRSAEEMEADRLALVGTGTTGVAGYAALLGAESGSGPRPSLSRKHSSWTSRLGKLGRTRRGSLTAEALAVAVLLLTLAAGLQVTPHWSIRSTPPDVATEVGAGGTAGSPLVEYAPEVEAGGIDHEAKPK